VNEARALLAQARYQLAVRGHEPWAGHLARAKAALGDTLPPMGEWEALNSNQRATLRQLLETFAS
jgi:hypothetical protein